MFGVDLALACADRGITGRDRERLFGLQRARRFDALRAELEEHDRRHGAPATCTRVEWDGLRFVEHLEERA